MAGAACPERCVPRHRGRSARAVGGPQRVEVRRLHRRARRKHRAPLLPLVHGGADGRPGERPVFAPARAGGGAQPPDRGAIPVIRDRPPRVLLLRKRAHDRGCRLADRPRLRLGLGLRDSQGCRARSRQAPSRRVRTGRLGDDVVTPPRTGLRDAAVTNERRWGQRECGRDDRRRQQGAAETLGGRSHPRIPSRSVVVDPGQSHPRGLDVTDRAPPRLPPSPRPRRPPRAGCRCPAARRAAGWARAGRSGWRRGQTTGPVVPAPRRW